MNLAELTKHQLLQKIIEFDIPLHCKSKNKKEKVVKLVSTNEWNDLGLSWKEKKETTNEIIFTSEILEK